MTFPSVPAQKSVEDNKTSLSLKQTFLKIYPVIYETAIIPSIARIKAPFSKIPNAPPELFT